MLAKYSRIRLAKSRLGRNGHGEVQRGISSSSGTLLEFRHYPEVNTNASKVRIADVDGDGRAE